MAEFRAPANDGEVLAVPDFAAVPALVEANRRKLDRDDITIGGLPLRELRALARREVLELARASSSSPSPLEGEGGLSAPADKPGEGKAGRSVEALPSPGGEAPSALSLKGRGREDAPLLLTGHQPELAHPGVWVKNFALCGLAKKLGGIALHLVVDNDTLKSTSLRFPVFRDRDPNSVHPESLAFDSVPATDAPYAGRRVEDVALFESFGDRSTSLTADWTYEPLLNRAWPSDATHSPKATIGDRFSAMRQRYEREWGCDNLQVSVSRLSQTSAYARFLWQVLTDLPRFREVFNAAVRNYREANRIESPGHPVPELARSESDIEAPFWFGLIYPSWWRRKKLFVGRRNASGELPFRVEKFLSDLHPFPGELDEFVAYMPKYQLIWPRALTLTLFARVCLGDFFIHGIGGGKYDEVTDAIIRDYFGIEPPAYQVLSATLHLPLPGFPSTPDDLQRAEHRVRDLHWNPQRHLPPGVATELIERKAALAAAEPPRTDRASRRAWFRALRQVTDELRLFVAGQEPEAGAELERVRAEVAANEVLRRRDYAWVLYPEETLRPFLQRFLNV